MILAQNRAQKRLDGWFLAQEIRMGALKQLRSGSPLSDFPLSDSSDQSDASDQSDQSDRGAQAQPAAASAQSRSLVQAQLFEAVCRELPISIRPGEIFAGTQADAFARTYALINPEFRVETFAGYCDPMAVYNDITPAPELGLTAERIKGVRDFWAGEEFAAALGKVYAKTGLETGEVVYFVEQVTGHTIADFAPALSGGLLQLIEQAKAQAAKSTGATRDFFEAMQVSLSSAIILAERYAQLAEDMARNEADAERKAEFERIAATCCRVPCEGARNLYEAIQSFILLWMAMTFEQCPNPYAFSVGNLDRILQPFYDMQPVARESAIHLVRHLLLLFCVGDRNWAISQNIMVGGRDERGSDLTCAMTTIILEAFYRSNTPQPALSVKLHAGTPDAVYDAMTPFFTTPGSVTPSFFNDDVLFDALRRKGIAEEDLPNYAIAGCQEPLIMGKESGNTTNSWLNLGKVLELTIHGGVSAISGERIGLGFEELGLDARAPLADPERLKAAFWKQLDYFLPRMEAAANGCVRALALLPVPFLSAFMGGLETGRDMRDVSAQGTKYNASGCLIHGLSVVADSFATITHLSAQAPEKLSALPEALRKNFTGFEDLRDLCLSAPKFGNDDDRADSLAVEIARDVSQRVHSLRNPWNNPFLPDWSTPSTHLLYGYLVGATPDGRAARAMLGYGVDPTAGMATHGLPPRIMSAHKLPFTDFLGGYASHIGLDPQMVRRRGNGGDGEEQCDEAGKQRSSGRFMAAMRNYVLNPLFGFCDAARKGGYYVYFNVDSAKNLRRLLADPKRLAPSGVYIMRIHGTFVNFLDLSPAIQEDIIARLDPDSTRIGEAA
ncbi:MAG: pyruvate formate lyase family protein [Candidatus Sumerlaeota bacterium]|nr:pyruvate formate lyase family protein [Candidatus Sumerlaeota bacterium]